MEDPHIATLHKCLDEIRSQIDRAHSCLNDAQEGIEAGIQQGFKVNTKKCGTSFEGMTDGVFWRVEVGVKKPRKAPGLLVVGPRIATRPVQP